MAPRTAQKGALSTGTKMTDAPAVMTRVEAWKKLEIPSELKSDSPKP